MTSTFPFYPQLDQMDCGPACLQMIAKFYGRSYSQQELRKKSYISREGVTLLGISEAAETIGLRTIGVKIPFDKLQNDATLPAIVHWRERHFIVVYKISKGKIHVADPAVGLIKYSEKEFIEGWSSLKENEHNRGGIALLIEPSPNFSEMEPELIKNKTASLNYIFGYLFQHGKLILQLALGLIAGSLIQLAFPFLTQSIVDVGINTKNVSFIYLILFAQLTLFFGRTLIEFTRRWILLYLSSRINISIISDFLAKLFKLPISFFESKMIGDLLTRVDDHTRIENFLSTSSLSIAFSFFNLILFGVVLSIYNVSIFIVFMGLSILYICFVLLFQKARAKLNKQRFQELSNNQNSLIQIINGMSEIKMNNCETHKRWEWERIQAKMFRINISTTKLQQWQDAGGLLFNETKNMIITIMSALAVMDGNMTLGMMLAVQYIIGQLNSPINEFISFTRDWQDAKISLERIGEIQELENEEKEPGDKNNLPIENNTFVLNKVSFQYEGPHSPKVLDGIDLVIPSGKITAIVGTSGSGKTTLMKLLLKFYNSTEGRITVGGNDFGYINATTWRKHCSAVLQDGYIFSDTIARNIALSTPDEINLNQLLFAATAANIKEFIDTLPLKFNTKIGMNGVGLSQGQRQRLLIARAIYKNPQIIFFDEATSSLDSNNEKVIMNNLNSFFENKTVVVIAHRLSTVRNADQIVVLENGKIVETGNHSELTAIKGKYFELVKNQLELGA